MNNDLVIKVVAAINLRNECAKGLHDTVWISEQAFALVEIGFWNDSQIAAIVGYTRQGVSTHARKNNAERPPTKPLGGTLVPNVLDIILLLQASVAKGEEPSANLIQAAIKTGTSTKLISRLTEIPIGTILYQQRKLKKETP